MTLAILSPHDWNQLVKVTLALLAIVNPIGGIPLYISATAAWSNLERARTARTIAITVFCVLAASAFFGDRLLDFFGISLPSFQVGGGILILLMAISMLQARQSPMRQTPEEAEETADRQAIGVVPLGIPLLAGPGAISSVIIAAHAMRGGLLGQAKLLLPILAISLLVWGIFVLSVRISRRLGTTGINIVTRLMGLILAALAVEFIARGLGELFPKLV
ncbi:MAG: MarC family protein [Burkholderiales bacterium]